MHSCPQTLDRVMLGLSTWWEANSTQISWAWVAKRPCLLIRVKLILILNKEPWLIHKRVKESTFLEWYTTLPSLASCASEQEYKVLSSSRLERRVAHECDITIELYHNKLYFTFRSYIPIVAYIITMHVAI